MAPPTEARCVFKKHGSFPAGHWNDLKNLFAAFAMGGKTHDFADCERMSHRDRQQAYEREKPIILRDAFDALAAEGIGSIENNQLDSGFPARAKTQHRGPDERVIAGSDVREIHNQCVQPSQCSGPRREGVESTSVQAVERNTEWSFNRGADRLHVLGFSGESVFRPEQNPDIGTGVSQRGQDVFQIGCDARGVGHNADPPATECFRTVSEEIVQSGGYFFMVFNFHVCVTFYFTSYS
jgi:hypothetical protein